MTNNFYLNIFRWEFSPLFKFIYSLLTRKINKIYIFVIT